MSRFKKTAIALGVAQFALVYSSALMAQTSQAAPAEGSADAVQSSQNAAGDTNATPAAQQESGAQKSTANEAPKSEGKTNVIVVTGQRAALQSAQNIKKNSDEIVDSIVAEDIGKLPDRSVTEVLQRVVGVTIERTAARNDPDHFTVEGAGVNVRGMSMVRSELNGRDSFGANVGRSLSFEDVPPELMAAVDVYKNPSAARIEGGIGGLVNLRTAMPFDYSGLKLAASADGMYSELAKKWSPSASFLISNRGDTELGQFGVLLSVAKSNSKNRNDQVNISPYYLINPNGTWGGATLPGWWGGGGAGSPAARTTWVPAGMGWSRNDNERDREGLYGALQWKKDNMKSSVTYFESDFRHQWQESAIVGGMQSPMGNKNVDWAPTGLAISGDSVVSDRGVFQRGTITNPGQGWDGGSDYGLLNFGSSTRISNRVSNTKELAWNFNVRPNDHLSLDSDLQLLRSTTHGEDYTVGTGTLLHQFSIDPSSPYPHPVFDSATQADLLNPANTYWNYTMEHLDRAKATGKAWRGEATLFLDDPVLHEAVFGVRIADKDFKNTYSTYHWKEVTATWQWQGLGGLATLDKYPAGSYTKSFDDFFGGKVSVPDVLLPTASLAGGFPDQWGALHSLPNAGAWTPLVLGADPSDNNYQKERTEAAYGVLNFGFDDLKTPLTGNFGLRAVRTQMKADGYLIVDNKLATYTNPVGAPGVALPTVPSFAAPYSAEHTYTKVLPSLNLKLEADKGLQFRFAAAQAITRPDYSQTQSVGRVTIDAAQKHNGTDANGNPATIIDEVSINGQDNGNPLLKPIRSNQFDLTAEWYFAKTGALTVAVFDKELKDLIVTNVSSQVLTDPAGNSATAIFSHPVNGAKGYARGVEFTFQRYFDMLPDWMSGFGVQVNYTFIDSKVKPYQPVTGGCGTSSGADNLMLGANGCDTNGVPFSNLPLVGLSRDNYNLALLYDQGPLSARLAYSWRSKYLLGANVWGTHGDNGMDMAANQSSYALPTWADAFGQLDGGVTYRFSDNKASVSLEAQNLTNTVNRTLMQQQIGMMTHAVNYSGRRVLARVNVSF